MMRRLKAFTNDILSNAIYAIDYRGFFIREIDAIMAQYL